MDTTSERMKSKKVVPEVIGFRPNELSPVIQLWLNENPHSKLTSLIKRGLKHVLKPYAGKRYAHLVADER